jgi:hypothetical protein
MATTHFDRDSLARWYSKQHRKTDPGLVAIWYLPQNSPEREIRLVEVNSLLGERIDDFLEPIDFGIDTGTENAHKLMVLDVTPEQWERIEKRDLRLPTDWSLDGALALGR